MTVSMNLNRAAALQIALRAAEALGGTSNVRRMATRASVDHIVALVEGVTELAAVAQAAVDFIAARDVLLQAHPTREAEAAAEAAAEEAEDKLVECLIVLGLLTIKVPETTNGNAS